MNVEALGLQTLAACRERRWAGFETAISRPVPEIAEGSVRLWYFLYRSQVRPPRQIIYAPSARVVIDYATGQILEHIAAPQSEEPIELGEYPHAAARKVSLAQWDTVWDELFALYPSIIAAFLGQPVAEQAQKVTRFVELFALTEPPFVMPIYRTLNPAFFSWLGHVGR